MARLGPLATATRRLGTHRIDPLAVDALRSIASSKRPPDPSQLLLVLALVEEIHDAEAYGRYAAKNTELLAPFAADLTVVARAMTRDLPRFQELYCTASIGAAPVDRMPFIIGRGSGIAEWFSCEAYAANALVRHRSSGHCNVHIVEIEEEEERCALEAVQQEQGVDSAPFVVLLTFERGSSDAALHDALSTHGAHPLVSRVAATTAAPNRAHLTVEGTPVERFDIVRLPTWASVEALAAHSLAAATAEFERGGGAARMVAFCAN